MVDQPEASRQQTSEKYQSIRGELKRETTAGTITGLVTLGGSLVLVGIIPVISSLIPGVVLAVGGTALTALLLRNKLKRQKELEKIRKEPRKRAPL